MTENQERGTDQPKGSTDEPIKRIIVKGTYVFFTYTINNVGGAQLYVRAKCLHLLEQGWRVRIFFYQHGELLIKDFEQMQNFSMPELAMTANLYSSRKRRKIIINIVRNIGFENDDIVIESHASGLSTWAEIVSKQMCAKHIVYIIDEKPLLGEEIKHFFQFKYNRRELVGITPFSVEYLFKDVNFELTYGSPGLDAYGCNDCILDVEYDLSFLKDCKSIGLLGRLEKEYMKDKVDELVTFFNKHNDKLFNVVYIGGEERENAIKNEIVGKYKHVTNVNLIFAGHLFPIPLKLVKSFDFCVSGAGASIALARNGIPTVTVDPRDGFANGVLGVTTEKTIYSDEGKQTLTFWLEDLLVNSSFYAPHIAGNEYHYEKHFRFIDKSIQSKEYDLSFLRVKGLKMMMERIVCTLFSPRIVQKIMLARHKLLNKSK